MTPEELKKLARELAEAMPPQRMELALTTGELLSEEAMAIARLYDQSTPDQQSAFDSIAYLVREVQRIASG